MISPGIKYPYVSFARRSDNSPFISLRTLEKEAKEGGIRAVILKTNTAALLTMVEAILGGNPNPRRPAETESSR